MSDDFSRSIDSRSDLFSVNLAKAPTGLRHVISQRGLQSVSSPRYLDNEVK